MASGLATLLATILLIVSVGAQQQQGCTTQLSLLAPCLPFVQGGSVSPTDDCCNQLGVVLDNNPLCLCAVLAGPGVPINSTLALVLPVRCNMKNVPDASRCSNAAGAPSNSQQQQQQQARQQGSPSPAPSASPKSSGRRLAPAPAFSSPQVARAPAPVATAPAMAATQDVPAAAPASSSSSQPFLPVTVPAPAAAATSAASFEAVSASSLLLGLLWSLL